MRFHGAKFAGCVAPQEKVLLGVHFYDVKAIDQTDLLFSERNYDVNYMANRESTTIVASNMQKVFARAFFGSVGTDVEPKGHDAFLTKIAGGYVFETRTPKGEALLKHGALRAGLRRADRRGRRQANAAALSSAPRSSAHVRTRSPPRCAGASARTRCGAQFAADCFSCGSCNTVCPTCYCFDVQDTWNVDQKSGQRTRYWDACLTEEFAKISLGAGGTENFREERGERFRHRFMRKAAYLNAKLGGPACVGCGRCSAGLHRRHRRPGARHHKIMES